jgi:exopolysaccharide biosynthesis polyprenyl glycosylphosphotransferase
VQRGDNLFSFLRKIIPLHKLIFVINDLVLVTVVLIYAASRIPPWSKIHNYTVIGYIGFVLSFIVIFQYFNLYRYQVVLSLPKHTGTFFKALTVHMTLSIYVCFFLSSRIQRPLIIDIYALLIGLSLLTRIIIIPRLYFWLVKHSQIKQNLLIIGAGKRARIVTAQMSADKANYYKIAGYLDDDPEKLGKEFGSFRVLDKIDNVGETVKKHHINDIFIAINHITDERLEDIVELCKDTGKTIHIDSSMYSVVKRKLFVEEISSTTAFRIVPNKVMPYYGFFKRLIDIFVASLLIVVLFPVWLAIYIAVRTTSSGPGFYRAHVVGKDQKHFYMLKFRSMYYGASIQSHVDRAAKMIKNNQTVDKDENDPRITPFGRFMRKYSIDEFPQLWSVIKGDMSLVGPRPCVPYEFEQMKEWHKKRFTVIPGMTGLWQIKGRAEVKFNEQIVLDLYYIENRSLTLDLEILAKTAGVVLFGHGGK